MAKRKRHRTGVTTKLLVIILLVLVLPMVLCVGLVGKYLMDYEKRNYLSAMFNNIEQIGSGLRERIEQCGQIAAFLATDSATIAFLENRQPSDVYLVQELLHSEIPKLNTVRLLNAYVNDVRIFHGNPAIFDVYGKIYYLPALAVGDWNAAFPNQRAVSTQRFNLLYISGAEYERTGSGTGAQVVYVRRPIYSISGKIIGAVEVSVKMDTLTEPFTGIDLNNGEVLQLIGPENEILYSSAEGFYDESASYKTAGEGAAARIGQEDYQVFGKPAEPLGAWIVLYIPYVKQGGEIYKNVVALVGGISGLACILLAFFSNRLFSKNIRLLGQAINRVKEGDLDAVADIRSGDELQYLAEHFNDMTSRVKALLEDIEAANRAELANIYRALENQMKPHFLCNALDFIRMSAELDNNSVISESIQQIMNYFNYNMNRREVMVTLREELTNVKDFISIYNIIYHGKVGYLFDIEPEITALLDRCGVIKYTLQPIVENAIKHGFAHKTEDCFVSLELGRAGDECITLCVEDNGAGMDRQTREALLASVKESRFEAGGKVHSGVGLTNLHERMRLVYKSECSLDIESYPGVGTRIIITIPIRAVS